MRVALSSVQASMKKEQVALIVKGLFLGRVLHKSLMRPSSPCLQCIEIRAQAIRLPQPKSLAKLDPILYCLSVDKETFAGLDTLDNGHAQISPSRTKIKAQQRPLCWDFRDGLIIEEIRTESSRASKHYLVEDFVRSRRQRNLLLEHVAILLQIHRLLPVIEGASNVDFIRLVVPDR